MAERGFSTQLKCPYCHRPTMVSGLSENTISVRSCPHCGTPYGARVKVKVEPVLYTVILADDLGREEDDDDE